MEPVTDFLDWLRQNYPDLGQTLGKLDADGRARLAAILQRFDTDGSGRLGGAEKNRARDVLHLLRDPSNASLETLGQMLGYLDVNAATRLDRAETDACIELLGLAGRAANQDGLASAAELWQLLEQMRAMDKNADGRLSVQERTALIGQLGAPKR